MIDTYLLIVCRLNYPHSIWNHVHSFWLLSPFWMMYEAKNCVIQMMWCTFCNLLLIFSISPLHNFVNCCNWMILLSTFFSEMLLKSVGTIHFICVGSECEIECCLFFFYFGSTLFSSHTMQCNGKLMNLLMMKKQQQQMRKTRRRQRSNVHNTLFACNFS